MSHRPRPIATLSLEELAELEELRESGEPIPKRASGSARQRCGDRWVSVARSKEWYLNDGLVRNEPRAAHWCGARVTTKQMETATYWIRRLAKEDDQRKLRRSIETAEAAWAWAVWEMEERKRVARQLQQWRAEACEFQFQEYLRACEDLAVERAIKEEEAIKAVRSAMAHPTMYHEAPGRCAW